MFEQKTYEKAMTCDDFEDSNNFTQAQYFYISNT